MTYRAYRVNQNSKVYKIGTKHDVLNCLLYYCNLNYFEQVSNYEKNVDKQFALDTIKKHL